MIHQYKNNGYNIVMDVNSGAVHVVDDVVYDAVALMEAELEPKTACAAELEPETVCAAELEPETACAAGQEPEAGQGAGAIRAEDSPAADSPEIPAELWSRVERQLAEKYGYSAQDIADAMSDIQELIEAEQLFTQDIYHDYVIDFKKRKTVVKALCLHIAHDCNLACRYCFAEEGEYHGRRALMSFEVGKKALDFLIANSGNRKHLEVDFFGGEPLMNWDVVKRLVEYGRSQEAEHDKQFRFTLTTNGVLLNDEIMEFCNREMSNVVMSLDGRKEVNDRMRPFRRGAGSYDIIVPKFQKFAESRRQMNYYVRGTFTRYNLDFASDVLHFADLGFKQMSVEPVVASPDEPYAIRKEDLPQILAEYDRLAVEYIKRKKEGRGFNFFHFMIDLNQGPCVAKRLSGCGSGTEYLAVTPWGDLYPCHQFVGQEQFLLGNVDEGITNTELRDEFKLVNVYAKDKCRNCFARFYCSGGCAANAWNYDGSITGAYEIGCEMQKKRIECAIMIKAALAEDEA